MNHPALVSQRGAGFKNGYTSITVLEEPRCNTGIEFGIRIQTSSESLEELTEFETAWVLLQGEAEVEYEGRKAVFKRECIFKQAPSVLHLSRGKKARIQALSKNVEWARIATPNSRDFPTEIYLPDQIGNEQRGKGLVGGTCERTVRLAFDSKISPHSNLVLGEVVNLAGRWSSYPPHHHSQPEIYHYRFSLPQGYGHAELGEEVLKVRHGDTVKIMGGLDHAQVSAPGYGMYYLWVVRHLPGNSYEGFEFTEAHRWIIEGAN